MANDNSNVAIDAELQAVEQELSSPSPSSTPGQAVFQSIRSALGNVRQRLLQSDASSSANLWDRFRQAEHAHEHRIPLPIVQQQQAERSRSVSSVSGLGRRSTSSSRFLDDESVSSRRSTLLASRKQIDGLEDRDLHESTTTPIKTGKCPVEKDATAHHEFHGDDDPMEEVEVIFQDTVPAVVLSQRTRSAPASFDVHSPSNSSRGSVSPLSRVYAWGEAAAHSVTTLSSVVHCSLNDHHVACTTASGQVWTAGNNGSGEVAPHLSREVDPQQQPMQLDLSHQAHIIQVSCGYDHTAALRGNGAVLTWGGNEHGQLGHRVSSPSSTFFCRPAAMALPHRVTQVVCGDGFTLCLTDRQQVWCCGILVRTKNTESTTSAPLQPILPHLPAVSVAAGRRHAVVVTVHGSAFVWGDNSMGACGQEVPKYLDVPVPVKLPRGDGQVPLSPPLSGWTRSTALCSSTIGEQQPCQHIVPIHRVVSAACGNDHTILVTEQGFLVLFGRNKEGQLGVRGCDMVCKPHVLAHPQANRRFTQADAGSAHTVVLDEAGVLWRLGGEGGRITSTTALEQISKPGITIQSVAAGGDSTLAISALKAHMTPLVVSNLKSNAADAFGASKKSLVSHSLDELLEHIAVEDTVTVLEVSERVVSEIKELFRSPAMLNSLPLDPTKLDMIFTKISSIQVPKFQATVANAIEASMYQGLKHAQSDAESMLKWPEQVRFLLLVIQCPYFVDWEIDESNKFDRRGDLILALCECILSLPYEGYKSFLAWATTAYPRDLYVRFLIRPLLRQIEKCLSFDAGAERRPLRAIVAVLKWFHTASERVEGSALSEDYYSEAIGSMSPEELFHDLHRYKNATPEQKRVDFFLAANSFLFSPSTKRMLLHIENEVSMMRSATSGMTFSMMQGGFMMRPYFVLDVDRQNLLQETLNKIAVAQTSDLQKKLRVVFRGEEGVDGTYTSLLELHFH